MDKHDERKDQISTVQFSKKKLEQAEVGQSPTLLTICPANGSLSILRECFGHFNSQLSLILEFP